jgi:hypothetical protein
MYISQINTKVKSLDDRHILYDNVSLYLHLCSWMAIISLRFMSDIFKLKITIITCADKHNSIIVSTQFQLYVLCHMCS